MQNIISACIVAALLLVISCVRGWRKRKGFFFYARIPAVMLLVICIMLYLAPFSYQLPEEENLRVTVYYEDRQIKIDGKEDIAYIKGMVEGMSVRREFYQGHRHMRSMRNHAYAYMTISSKDSNEPYHLGLHFIIMPVGNYPISCFDNDYATAANPENIIAYVTTILD